MLKLIMTLSIVTTLLLGNDTPASVTKLNVEEIVETAIIDIREFQLAGAFSQHDFVDAPPAFDWVYITPEGRMYQLQGNPPTEDNVFGWKEVFGINPPPVDWYMFSLGSDVDGDGSTKFDWAMISPRIGFTYKLTGETDQGTFAYSDKLSVDYYFGYGYENEASDQATDNEAFLAALNKVWDIGWNIDWEEFPGEERYLVKMKTIPIENPFIGQKVYLSPDDNPYDPGDNLGDNPTYSIKLDLEKREYCVWVNGIKGCSVFDIIKQDSTSLMFSTSPYFNQSCLHTFMGDYVNSTVNQISGTFTNPDCADSPFGIWEAKIGF